MGWHPTQPGLIADVEHGHSLHALVTDTGRTAGPDAEFGDLESRAGMTGVIANAQCAGRIGSTGHRQRGQQTTEGAPGLQFAELQSTK